MLKFKHAFRAFCGGREVRGRENLLGGELRSFENELNDDWGGTKRSYRCELSVDGAIVWDFLFVTGESGIRGCVGCGDAVDCRVVAADHCRGRGLVVLGQEGVVED